MSDFRVRTNARVEAALMSRPIFDPASLDDAPRPPLVDFELLELNELSLDADALDDLRMPWEVLL